MIFLNFSRATSISKLKINQAGAYFYTLTNDCRNGEHTVHLRLHKNTIKLLAIRRYNALSILFDHKEKLVGIRSLV